jgi:group I intron endonuclease
MEPELDSGVIYVIRNKINGKKYIGQAVSYSSKGKIHGSLSRWKSHVNSALSNICECRYLENAIRKYGSDNFTVNDILECGIHELNSFEDEYIQEYNTLAPNGYNLMTGGGNGRRHHEITKQKMSESRKKLYLEDSNRLANIGKDSKYRNMTEENKTKILDALKILGIENLPMYVCLSIDRRYKRNVDKITVRIPKKPSKQFSIKNMSLVDKIKLAIEYLKSNE